MADQDSDEFQEIRELWDVLSSISASNGIDMLQFVHAVARLKRDSLSQWASERDFDELCNAGCGEVSLAIALWAIKASQRWGTTWRTAVGSKRDRNQAIGALQKAAAVLGELQESLIAAVMEDVKMSLREDLRKPPDIDAKSLSLDLEAHWPRTAPGPPPTTVIRALRLYSRILRLFDILPEETQAHSPEAFSKYLISAYVKRATGDFHDVEVSALIGSALGTMYDETAHRMWRSRNYEQIEKTSSSLAEFLVGIGVVTAQKA